MKVKCIKIYNEHTKKYEDKSLSLTIGKEYVVMEVSSRPERATLYRLVSDSQDKMPALYNSIQFETITNNIPSSWIIKQWHDMIVFSPALWQKSGFWELCYDGDPEALEIYKHEARIMLEEENAL
jgi:hypothetical protein